MIFVTGLPRSGTSLVTGVIRACGAWTGQTIGPSSFNRKGNVENEAIREQVVKPILSQIPTCPLGLRSLPVIGYRPRPYPIRDTVQVLLRRQGYKHGPVVYKDAKIALIWRLWAEAFPGAKWVIVERDVNYVIDSVMRAEPMMRHFQSESVVRAWADAYQMHVSDIDVPQKMIVRADDNLWPMIEWLGLDWNQTAVDEWIDWDLYRGNR